MDDIVNEGKIGGPSSRNINNVTVEITIAEASSMFPGFRFSPTDDELIQYYLRKKLRGSYEGVQVITEVDICKHEPWDLPALAVIQSDNEWFFFSARGRKYPNGSQSKRATPSGYWKATGKERGVKSGPNLVGTKRTLVFHIGRAPRGQRTEWIMHEYCSNEKSENGMVVCRLRKNKEFHVNDTARRITDSPFSGGEQSGMIEKTNVVDSGSNSYNSHSVEQADTGSESDCQAGNDFLHHESSSFKKSDAEEDEDCYADIMKDDIVKLDEDDLGSLSTSKSNFEASFDRSEANSNRRPFQGTAIRRLRLGRNRLRRMGSHKTDPFQIRKSYTKDVPIGSARKFRQRLERLVARVKYPTSIFVFMLLLIVILVMFSMRVCF